MSAAEKLRHRVEFIAEGHTHATHDNEVEVDTGYFPAIIAAICDELGITEENITFGECDHALRTLLDAGGGA